MKKKEKEYNFNLIFQGAKNARERPDTGSEAQEAKAHKTLGREEVCVGVREVVRA